MFGARDEVVGQVRAASPAWDSSKCSEAFSLVSREMVRDLIFEEGLRVDGRGLRDIRTIACEVGLYEPLDGSALFQRRQTQVG